jgi:hypothetical protein
MFGICETPEIKKILASKDVFEGKEKTPTTTHSIDTTALISAFKLT